MKALVIQQPHIDNILQGKKIWEMRSRVCHHRGTVGLIQSKSGLVIGTAEIIDCLGPLTDSERLNAQSKHCVSSEKWHDPDFEKYKYAWVMQNARRLPKPVPYHHKPGAVIWVSLGADVQKAVEIQALGSNFR